MSLLICRSCLCTSTELVSLEEGNYKQSFMDLAGIKVKEFDGLPQSICTACAHLFTEFSGFRERVLCNNQILIETMEQRKVKELCSTNTSEGKYGYIEVDIKEESLEDFPVPEIVEMTDNFSLHKIKKAHSEKTLEYAAKKKRKNVKDKNKIKSKKSKSLKCQLRTRRVIIEVDPDKINTIRLDIAEQRKRHESEATSPAFLAMPHRCLKCYKGFNYERKLEAHIDKYHKEGARYACKVCQRTLVNGASLALHEARHGILYECRACMQTYVEKKQAIAHYQSAHEGIQPTVTCKYCGMNFRHRSTLNGHLRSRHPQTERPTCDTCGKSFVSKDSLLDHLLIHSGEKRHACITCGKRFRLKAEVTVHARTHGTARPFYCTPCDKHFKTHTSYNNHHRLSRAHLDPNTLREHMCVECGHGFACAWQLRAHAARHNEGRAAHACPHCAAHLSSRASLRKHVRATHLRIPPPKNHICHACGKRFSGSLMLENHIRVHTGEKPFTCEMEECAARFSQKSTLQTHIRLVHLKQKRGKSQSGVGYNFIK